MTKRALTYLLLYGNIQNQHNNLFTFLNLCQKLGTTQLFIKEAHEHHTLWRILL